MTETQYAAWRLANSLHLPPERDEEVRRRISSYTLRLPPSAFFAVRGALGEDRRLPRGERWIRDEVGYVLGTLRVLAA